MALRDSSVSIESFVRLERDIDTRFETCSLNDYATLYFGYREEYILSVDRLALSKIISVATDAMAELQAADGNEA